PPLTSPNPTSRPQSTVAYDAGLEHRPPGHRHRPGATYYHHRIRDLITTDVTGTTWANVGRATTDGVESFIACQPARQLTLRLDYTYTEATDDVLQQELLRRPRHKGTLNADWQLTQALRLD